MNAKEVFGQLIRYFPEGQEARIRSNICAFGEACLGVGDFESAVKYADMLLSQDCSETQRISAYRTKLFAKLKCRNINEVYHCKEFKRDMPEYEELILASSSNNDKLKLFAELPKKVEDTLAEEERKRHAAEEEEIARKLAEEKERERQRKLAEEQRLREEQEAERRRIAAEEEKKRREEEEIAKAKRAEEEQALLKEMEIARENLKRQEKTMSHNYLRIFLIVGGIVFFISAFPIASCGGQGGVIVVMCTSLIFIFGGMASLIYEPAVKVYNQGVELYKNKLYGSAFEKFEKAAQKGYHEAQNQLGYCYNNGKGTEKNDELAVMWYREAAEQWNMYAQYNLGVMYSKGCGVPQDYVEARKWFLKSALQGNDSAQNSLGVMYYYGHGGEQSREEARRWFAKAAKQGNSQAKNNLKNI